MSLSAFDDNVADTPITGPVENVVRNEALPLEKTALDLHDEEAVGVPPRRSLRPVLHGQSPHRPQ